MIGVGKLGIFAAAGAAGGGGAFDPLSIGWHTAFWAEGAEFVALGLSDADPVSNWPDEASTHDASQGTAGDQPTYNETDADFNNQPAIQSVSSDWMATSAFAALSQPNTIAVVGSMKGDGATAGSFLCDGINSNNRHAIFHRNNLDDLSIFAGSQLNAVGDRDTDTHLFVITYDGVSSSIERDGVTLASGDVGSHTLTGLTLFSYVGQDDFFGDKIAFLGLRDGTLTAQEKADLLSWSQSHYGTP